MNFQIAIGLAYLILLLATPVCSQYDENTAVTLVYYAKIGYANPDLVEIWNCSYCNSVPLRTISTAFEIERKLYAYSGYSPSLNAFIVSMSGDPNFLDFINDLTADLSDYNNTKCGSKCQVNSLLHAKLMKLSTKITNSMAKLIAKYGQKRVYFVGHGLGGGMICLYSVMFA